MQSFKEWLTEAISGSNKGPGYYLTVGYDSSSTHQIDPEDALSGGATQLMKYRNPRRLQSQPRLRRYYGKQISRGHYVMRKFDELGSAAKAFQDVIFGMYRNSRHLGPQHEFSDVTHLSLSYYRDSPATSPDNKDDIAYWNRGSNKLVIHPGFESLRDKLFIPTGKLADTSQEYKAWQQRQVDFDTAPTGVA